MDRPLAPISTAAERQAPHQPVGPDAPQGARACAVLLFELRRVPRAGTRITPEIEQTVINRCVLAALDALSAAGAAVTLAGTERRPEVEARFEGELSAIAAVRAAGAVLGAVRRAQRASENEVHLAAAVSVGAAEAPHVGAVPAMDSAESVVHRLSEIAGPGQVVISPAVRRACGDHIESVPVRSTNAGSGDPLEAFVLRRLAPEMRLS
jgi:class 3 adenylate cyclase